MLCVRSVGCFTVRKLTQALVKARSLFVSCKIRQTSCGSKSGFSPLLHVFGNGGTQFVGTGVAYFPFEDNLKCDQERALQDSDSEELRRGGVAESNGRNI